MRPVPGRREEADYTWADSIRDTKEPALAQKRMSRLGLGRCCFVLKMDLRGLGWVKGVERYKLPVIK